MVSWMRQELNASDVTRSESYAFFFGFVDGLFSAYWWPKNFPLRENKASPYLHILLCFIEVVQNYFKLRAIKADRHQDIQRPDKMTQ